MKCTSSIFTDIDSEKSFQADIYMNHKPFKLGAKEIEIVKYLDFHLGNHACLKCKWQVFTFKNFVDLFGSENKIL